MHPVLQVDETPLQVLGSLKRVFCGLRQRGRLRGGICSGDVRQGPLMVDGYTDNMGAGFSSPVAVGRSPYADFLEPVF